MLNDIEMKLLRLALDSGATIGESEASAIMFIRKLRARNAAADDLFSQPGYNNIPDHSFNRRDYADEYHTMPFGKYRGEPLEDIPPSYLIWVLENCRNIKTSLRTAIYNVIYAD